MNLAELLKKGLAREVGADAKRAGELLAAARRDIKTARDNAASGNHDWALAIAYNAMLSAGSALMASKGYAPVTESHHLGVVQFCGAVFPAASAPLVNSFNRYRIRRHDVVYGEAGSVSPEEAVAAIRNAEAFVAAVQKRT